MMFSTDELRNTPIADLLAMNGFQRVDSYITSARTRETKPCRITAHRDGSQYHGGVSEAYRFSVALLRLKGF